ncbi:MAG: S-layer homology domain-containing protein [Patescibacteria group bacterium]|nr:S-layer homology domain-containing protein [Patescibacteria group bacterium]
MYPQKNVTRAEAAVIIARASQIDLSNTSHHVFDDTQKDAWYMTYLQALFQQEIIGGYKNNTLFRPDAYLSRAEAIKMILKAQEIAQESSTFYIQ